MQGVGGDGGSEGVGDAGGGHGGGVGGGRGGGGGKLGAPSGTLGGRAGGGEGSGGSGAGGGGGDGRSDGTTHCSVRMGPTERTVAPRSSDAGVSRRGTRPLPLSVRLSWHEPTTSSADTLASAARLAAICSVSMGREDDESADLVGIS